MAAALVDASGVYAALCKDIQAAGLLDRARGYYAWRLGVSFVLLIAGIALALVAPPVLLLPVTLLIALGSIQVALVGHDAGHLAVFSSRRANAVLGSLCWSLALGVSFWYWTDRHNRHHASPNMSERDPDVQWGSGPLLIPFLAFAFRVDGWRYAVRELRGARRVLELSLLTISTIMWLLPVLSLGWVWLPTVAVSQVFAGLYLACVVAPNHIGMPVWPPGSVRPFLERQLLSSRNVTPSRVNDFVFGGLNYQVEHHLFPSMPRRNFGAARALIKPFCAEHGLAYTELGVVAVFRLLVRELPRVGRIETV